MDKYADTTRRGKRFAELNGHTVPISGISGENVMCYVGSSSTFLYKKKKKKKERKMHKRIQVNLSS